MLAGVLDRALGDLKDGGHYGRNAQAWLANDDVGPMFGGWSFRVVCAHLGLSPEYLREHLPGIDLANAKRRRRVVGPRRVVGE